MTSTKPYENKIALRAVAAAAMFARPAPRREIAQWPPAEPAGPTPEDVFPAAPGLKNKVLNAA